MILERTELGWVIYDKNICKKYFLNSTQISELMDELGKAEFQRVYFNKKNTRDLVIELAQGNVVIKNYNNIKDRPYISNIKQKININLIKFALNKVIKKRSGKLVLATISSIVLLGAVHVIKNNDSDKIMEAPQIQIDELEPIISSSEVTIDTTTTPVPTATTTTTTTTTTDSYKYDFANECFDNYCEIFEIYDEEKEKIYHQNINKIIKEDNIEQSIIDILYDYYSENLYMQRPIYYNGYSEEEQEATILKYAKIKGIKDKEVLATMLAVHQLETGHGTSEVCYYKNNLGGNKVVNPYTGELEEHQTYPNVEVGAIDFVNDFVRIMKDTYDPNLPIEEYMNPVYCETDSWYITVKELKDNILTNNRLEEIEDVLTKMTKEEKGKSY